jgi:hypothetical protein
MVEWVKKAGNDENDENVGRVKEDCLKCLIV